MTHHMKKGGQNIEPQTTRPEGPKGSGVHRSPVDLAIELVSFIGGTAVDTVLADEVLRLRRVIAEHNSACVASCEMRDVCDAFRSRQLTCPDCPKDWIVDT